MHDRAWGGRGWSAACVCGRCAHARAWCGVHVANEQW
jgi:hypothetical protein